MSIYEEIINFAKARDSWMQDLIRRVVTQAEVSEKDLDEVQSMLFIREGLEPSVTVKPQPLAADHVPSRAPGKLTSVRLLELRDLSNVNCLAASQTMRFAPEGLTVIYGDNGSGKSGYSRVLKRLCRVRGDASEPVLSNVYVPETRDRSRATVLYSIDGKVQPPVQWSEGSPGPAELSQISIFDAAIAPLYAEGQNEIEFLPLGLDVMPALGRALEKLAARLDLQISALRASTAQPLPVVPAGTDVANLFLQLQAGRASDPNVLGQITALAEWNNGHQNQQAKLQARLRDLAEPQKLAVQRRRVKKTVEQVVRHIEELLARADDQAVIASKEAMARLDASRKAAALAASDLFAQEPFGKAVGTDPWRKLYEYAKEFSATVYPGEEFPVVGSDKFCVLCQQPLGEDASRRLERFKKFVAANAEQELRRAEAVVSRAVARVGEVKGPIQPFDVQLTELITLRESETDLLSLVTEYANVLTARRDSLIAFLRHETVDLTVAALPASPLARLREVATELDAEANAFEAAAADNKESQAVQGELDNLQARKTLSDNRAVVETRYQELERLRKLERCRTACDTRPVSLKNSEFRDKHLTAGFEQQVRKEVEGLEVGYLPLRVQAKTERGTSLIGVALQKASRAGTSQILSEGEYRALALACFFAEVDGIPTHDGIVVDDPVSSLDHLHMRQVARRLVEEAAKRQVVVFTHDLSFFFDLWESARDAAVPIVCHSLERTGPQICGKVLDSAAPWQAKKVKERLKDLEKKLGEIPERSSCSSQIYGTHVKEFYGLVRETWERLVEERLFNGVVGRFQPGVKTQSLRGVTVEDDDYRKVFSAMSKASNYSGHDMAVGRRTSPPGRDEMKKDLEELRTYDSELGKRAHKVGEQRKTLEEPLKAAVGIDGSVVEPAVQPGPRRVN